MSTDEFKEDSALKKDNGHYKVKEIVLQSSGNDLLKLNLEPPNYFKIDVDGLELGIIEGMKDIFKSDDLKSILVEINSKGDLVVVRNIFQVRVFFQAIT